MARRKKKTITRHHRRSRVGAVNKDLIMMAAGSIAGYVAGNMLSSSIAPTMDAKIKGAVIAAAGIIGVPMLLKSSLGHGLAIGMATSGGATILKSLGVISGVGSMAPVAYLPYPNRRRIAGAGINAQVNGQGINAMVNGSGINAMVNGGHQRRSAMQTAMKYA